MSAAHLANAVRSAGCRAGLRICRRPSSCRPAGGPIVSCKRNPEASVPGSSAAACPTRSGPPSAAPDLRICRNPSSCRPTGARSSPASGIRRNRFRALLQLTWPTRSGPPSAALALRICRNPSSCGLLRSPIVPCSRDPEAPVLRSSAAAWPTPSGPSAAAAALRICRRPSSCRLLRSQSSPADGIRRNRFHACQQLTWPTSSGLPAVAPACGSAGGPAAADRLRPDRPLQTESGSAGTGLVSRSPGQRRPSAVFRVGPTDHQEANIYRNWFFCAPIEMIVSSRPSRFCGVWKVVFNWSRIRSDYLARKSRTKVCRVFFVQII